MFKGLPWWMTWPVEPEELAALRPRDWLIVLSLLVLIWLFFMAFILLPMLISESNNRVIASVLPGCWEADSGEPIAFFGIEHEQHRARDSVVAFYPLYSDESIEDLSDRLISFYSPRLVIMTHDQRYAPWTIEMAGHDPIMVERIDDETIQISGNQIISSGIWTSCSDAPIREWRTGA